MWTAKMFYPGKKVIYPGLQYKYINATQRASLVSKAVPFTTETILNWLTSKLRQYSVSFTTTIIVSQR